MRFRQRGTTQRGRLEGSATTGPTAGHPTLTVAEWADEWLARNTASDRWCGGTARAQRQLLAHLRPLGEARLVDVTAFALQGLIDEAALGPRSRGQLLATVRHLFGDAVRYDLISSSPATKVRPPRQPARDQHAATDDEVTVLQVLAGPEPRWAAYVALALDTGARPGELCALAWANVDTRAGRLRIVDTMGKAAGGGYERRGRTKTGNSRAILITARAVDALTAWRALAPPSPWVFPHSVDAARPMTPANVSSKWQTWRAAGLPQSCHPYSLRHRHATYLLREGVGANDVAHRLGHSRPTLTLEVYGWHAGRTAADERGVARALRRDTT